jgi:hypothetical protein
MFSLSRTTQGRPLGSYRYPAFFCSTPSRNALRAGGDDVPVQIGVVHFPVTESIAMSP